MISLGILPSAEVQRDLENNAWSMQPWPTYILPAYENGACSTSSISKNGSDVQEAPNLLHQTKVCHFEPIGKISLWYVPIK